MQSVTVPIQYILPGELSPETMRRIYFLFARSYSESLESELS